MVVYGILFGGMLPVTLMLCIIRKGGMFYLTMHSQHMLITVIWRQSYMVKDHSDSV